MPLDLRVPMAPITDAFGLPITVTRAEPSDPIDTTGIWLPPLVEEQPFGTALRRREPRRVMSVPRSDVLATMPLGTVIVAAEEIGQAAKTWRVDALDRTERDAWRVILVPVSEVL